MAFQKWIFFLFSSFGLVTLIAGAKSDQWFYISYVDLKTPPCYFDGTEEPIECKEFKRGDDAQLWKVEGAMIVNKKTGNVIDSDSGLDEGARCLTYERNTEEGSENQQWVRSSKLMGKIASKEDPTLVLTMSEDKICTVEKESAEKQQGQFFVFIPDIRLKQMQ